MCLYCWLADWMHQYVPNPLPTSVPPWSPWTPMANPVPQPWTRDQYEQAVEILRCVKEMEDKLGGCPCEDPSKLDFLKDIEESLDKIEGKVDESGEDPAVSK